MVCKLHEASPWRQLSSLSLLSLPVLYIIVPTQLRSYRAGERGSLHNMFNSRKILLRKKNYLKKYFFYI